MEFGIYINLNYLILIFIIITVKSIKNRDFKIFINIT